MLPKEKKKKKPRRKHVTKSHVFAVSRIAATKICLLLVPPSRGSCLADGWSLCRVPCRLLSLSSQKKAVMRKEEGAGMMSLVSPEYETMYLVYSVPKAGPAFLPSFSLLFFFFATTQFTKVGVRLTRCLLS